MVSSRTKPSTLKLSDRARHVIAPAGVASTGWPAVEAKCADLGVSFRSWQPDIGRLILAKRKDGKYAATVGGTGLSIPRQCGKTFLVMCIIFALCLLRPGFTAIWTAHRLRTAEETFKKMQAFAKRRRIAPFVKRIILGSGEGSVEFHNGSRILFGARERGFGRGFDEVDAIVFDEGQILTEAALDDMVPAANQSRQATGALLLFMGTPPKPSDPGEVFARMRDEALSGEDEDTGWVEFGADVDYEPTPLPAPLTAEDWRQVARANPSFPEDTPREAILRMRKKLGAESFVREALGIWNVTKHSSIFGADAWPRCKDVEQSCALGAIGVAVERELSFSSLVGAGWVADGEAVQVKPLQYAPGTAWVVQRCKELQGQHGCAVAIDGRGPGALLIPHLEQAGVEVTVLKTGDVLDACAGMYDRVRSRSVRHASYAELDAAVEAAQRRTVLDRWAIGRKGDVDVSPLEAATFAVWALTKPTEEPARSVYEDRGVITV